MTRVCFDDLSGADLIVDAIYESGRLGDSRDEPLPHLLKLSNQGGFRYRGSLTGKLNLLVLVTGMDDPNWPDSLDSETGVFTYYGDNKQHGCELHDTKRKGNTLLKRLFDDSHGGLEGRMLVPPILLFARARASFRDVVFLGLAVPGVTDVTQSEDLVAVWKAADGRRFQNYRARFTILDVPKISRSWINSLLEDRADHSEAPPLWKSWRDGGTRKALKAPRALEYRLRSEQMPTTELESLFLTRIIQYFSGAPHAFEVFAASVTKMMLPDIVQLDLTRVSKDGGRDAIGKMRLGTGASAILVEFAIEAKCYSGSKGVGVKQISRLISRLRHRQFGVLVTTTWLDTQAYKEIKDDQHPIIVISGNDITRTLITSGIASPDQLMEWLSTEFKPA